MNAGVTMPDLTGETRISWQEHLIFGADRLADRLWYTPPQPLFASACHALGVAAIIVLLLVIVYRHAAYSAKISTLASRAPVVALSPSEVDAEADSSPGEADAA